MGFKSFPAEYNFYEGLLMKPNSQAPYWVAHTVKITKDKISTKAIYIITIDSKYCGEY